MQIKKRSLPMYIFLNCLTLGIYGFVVSKQVGEEINAICKGDKEEPHFGYMGAVAVRNIAVIVGLLYGLYIGLKASDALGFAYDILDGAYKAGFIIGSILGGGILGVIVASLTTGIYLNYWWYKQASRLKLNGQRYGIQVKEGGVDNLLFRTAMNVLFIPISIVLIVLSVLIPVFIIWLFSLTENNACAVIAIILFVIVCLILMFFGTELTTGANFAMYFVFKNLNRYATVYRNGAQPFDPMGYEYYPSCESKYPNFLPNMIAGAVVQNNQFGNDNSAGDHSLTDGGNDSVTTVGVQGILLGEKGSCAGYMFELTSGEEIIIGKDAKMSSVVIDSAYKEISRKHAGVCFDVRTGQYRVTDYSSNGTTVNGQKLTPGVPVFAPAGSVLELANGKNMFRLG